MALALSRVSSTGHSTDTGSHAVLGLGLAAWRGVWRFAHDSVSLVLVCRADIGVEVVEGSRVIARVGEIAR